MLEIVSYIIPWIFFAYTSYRIGNKLHINKSYPWYIIPLWNFWILAKKSEMRIKYFSLILIFILIATLLIWGFLFIDIPDVFSISIIGGADGPTSIFIANSLEPDLIGLIIGVTINVMLLIFWGSVAKKMGKKFWVYGVLGLFSIYLPPLFLAFESIEKMITTNKLSNMYSPLSKEEKEVLDKVNSMPKERINRVVSVGVLVLIIFVSIVYTVN